MSNDSISGDTRISGTILWEEGNKPVKGVNINLYSSGVGGINPLGTSKTDKNGKYEIVLQDLFAKNKQVGLEVYFVVIDDSGQILLSTNGMPLRIHGQAWEVNLSIHDQDRKKQLRPQIQVGPLQMDEEGVKQAKPEIVIDIARALVNPDIPNDVVMRITVLSPDLLPNRLVGGILCATPILEALDALIKLKGWPRETALEIDRILSMQDKVSGRSDPIYTSDNFIVTYQISGTDAVNTDTSSLNVVDPGTATVLEILPAGGPPPTYIKLVCFWLEHALQRYISEPFSMRNPAASGRIRVVINSSTSAGMVLSGTIYLNNVIPTDLMSAIAVHELFHVVQGMYWDLYRPGAWKPSLKEGGAVFAEDYHTTLMNRYLDEAGTNFTGPGVLSNPNFSLLDDGPTLGYKCCLFWRYISEQQSANMDGVETYRRILEECTAGYCTTDDVKRAIRELPWFQDFYEFGYLNSARRLDLTSSETIFGNYVLACYLKDIGNNVPDSRFNFRENGEDIYFDDVLSMFDPREHRSNATLARVSLDSTNTVTPDSSGITFYRAVNRFASVYYEFNIEPMITNINIQFIAGSGLTSHLFQVVLIDENNAVRDIHRTDAANYSKRITNIRDGRRLSKIAIIISGADMGSATSSGYFRIDVMPQTPSPDVMVTRWNSVVKTEYEIDSRNWSWTWVSPDIWVDNNMDGVADNQVFFNYNNKLYIRLHNKGNERTSGINVAFYYQSASGGLSDAWLDVLNMTGTLQRLTNKTLDVGESNNWWVDWSPIPSGASRHFCIKAVVTVPGDPNTDNKHVLSNFSYVGVRPDRYGDITLVRRNTGQVHKPVTMYVIPRLTTDFQVSLRDVKEKQTLILNPGETVQDVIRINHLKLGSQIIQGDNRSKTKEENTTTGFVSAKRVESSPDPLGYYKTDPRTLPPGVEGKPMVTVMYEADGLPLGGATFLVTIDDDDKQKQKRQL